MKTAKYFTFNVILILKVYNIIQHKKNFVKLEIFPFEAEIWLFPSKIQEFVQKKTKISPFSWLFSSFRPYFPLQKRRIPVELLVCFPLLPLPLPLPFPLVEVFPFPHVLSVPEKPSTREDGRWRPLLYLH